MLNKITICIFLFFLTLTGCASVHEGARKTGEAGGKAVSVPNSLSEGAAEGIKGQPESNPYNR